MEFGIQFFPDVGPAQKSGCDYWTEALHLVSLCDELGYTSVRTIEHYFHPYGGYSPNPMVFLAAAAMRTRHARLMTGAVIPAFNNPLKLAGEIGMLDAISGGRLEVGFARAFLPHEFLQFGIDMEESRARFDEGLEQIGRLLEEEKVSASGRFHSFRNVTSLPRPTQRPRPPFWIAALASIESFTRAGRDGYGIMAIPMAGGRMAELLGAYREAWQSAGHPGKGKVMLAFHMLCHQDADSAEHIARDPLNRYLKSLVDAASGWLEGTSSSNYSGYENIVSRLSEESYETQREKGAAWIGTPSQLVEQIRNYDAAVGGFEIASLQVNFNDISVADAEMSMRLFAEQVAPKFWAYSSDVGTR